MSLGFAQPFKPESVRLPDQSWFSSGAGWPESLAAVANESQVLALQQLGKGDPRRWSGNVPVGQPGSDEISRERAASDLSLAIRDPSPEIDGPLDALTVWPDVPTDLTG